MFFTVGSTAMAAMIPGSVRSTSTLVAATATMSRVAGLMVTSMLLTTRPKALALVTGTSRPILFGRPVGRGVATFVAALLPVTSTVVAEQL